jgi:hypothetical protein
MLNNPLILPFQIIQFHSQKLCQHFSLSKQLGLSFEKLISMLLLKRRLSLLKSLPIPQDKLLHSREWEILKRGD